MLENVTSVNKSRSPEHESLPSIARKSSSIDFRFILAFIPFTPKIKINQSPKVAELISHTHSDEDASLKNPQVSILIPSWNNLNQLKICLQSIAEHSRLSYQVIIHVNEGIDGTLEWLMENGVQYTHSQENIGICSAINRAYEKATADYIIYLNDDMYVLPEWDLHLVDALEQADPTKPAYASGTMIQSYAISASTIVADYGTKVESFAQAQLLEDFHAGKFIQPDWSGATWPPSCIHRRWWEMVFGYSEEFSPGFYSDIDFSMKLWNSGCRRFHGVSRSLVYHFGEQSTKRIRGLKNKNVKQARIRFLQKWGILPSTAVRHYLKSGQPFEECLPEPELTIDHARARLISFYYSSHKISQDLLKYLGVNVNQESNQYQNETESTAKA